MSELSHVDESGKARMVDVSQKKDQIRIAIAGGFIRLGPGTVQLIRDNQVKKGDVLLRIDPIQSASDTNAYRAQYEASMADVRAQDIAILNFHSC